MDRSLLGLVGLLCFVGMLGLVGLLWIVGLLGLAGLLCASVSRLVMDRLLGGIKRAVTRSSLRASRGRSDSRIKALLQYLPH